VYRDSIQISDDFECGRTYTAGLQPDGTYDYTVTAVDAAGNESPPSEPLTVTIFPVPFPTVENVLVKGSGWDAGFLDWLDGRGLGDPTVARLGYRLPGGAAQLDTLGWGNIDTITIVFNEDVVVAQGDLAIAGVNVASYTIAGFSYDAANYAATWTLAEPLNADRLWITLADTVQDIAGHALDGEWQNAAGQFPSGDGAAGGDFGFALSVLPGDVNHDGAVTAADAALLTANWGYTGAAWPPGDVTGDQQVDADDADVVASHWGARLLPWIPGDANYSGTVDDVDAAILAAHWGRSEANWHDGDFNGDHRVNAVDAALLTANWGATWFPTSEGLPPVADHTPLVGPVLPRQSAAARRPIAPAGRSAALLGDPEGDSPVFRATSVVLAEVSGRKTGQSPGRKTGQSPAATDAALVDEFGLQVEQLSLPRQQLVLSNMLAHRQSRERSGRVLAQTPLAVDLLLADQR